MCNVTDKNEFVDGIGYSGGIILSICLGPQIYKILKTQEVESISILWQILYITGIILHLYYSIYYNLLPIFIPTILELCLIIFLLFLKIIFKKNDFEINE